MDGEPRRGICGSRDRWWPRVCDGLRRTSPRTPSVVSPWQTAAKSGGTAIPCSSAHPWSLANRAGAVEDCVITIGPRCQVACWDAESGAIRWLIDSSGSTVPRFPAGIRGNARWSTTAASLYRPAVRTAVGRGLPHGRRRLGDPELVAMGHDSLFHHADDGGHRKAICVLCERGRGRRCGRRRNSPVV